MTARELVNLLENARDLSSNQKYCELGKRHGFDMAVVAEESRLGVPIPLFPIQNSD